MIELWKWSVILPVFKKQVIISMAEKEIHIAHLCKITGEINVNVFLIFRAILSLYLQA